VQRATGVDVTGLIDALVRDAGEPATGLVDPYAIVLHENAGYLVSDERRDELYARLVAVAPTPAAMLGADRAALIELARAGGMRPEQRVERWRTIAEITLEDADGDLAGALHRLPLPRAKKLLARYPVIGTPGVDRILLFAGIATVPSVDSNGLRVLERYAAIAAGLPYARGYREACAALSSAFPECGEPLRRAYVVLRRHGKTICRRARPECGRCPVATTCPSSTSVL
jgi:endonuclease III